MSFYTDDVVGMDADARSGDLAHSRGTGKVSVKHKKGKITETTAKYVSVGKKQPDGTYTLSGRRAASGRNRWTSAA